MADAGAISNQGQSSAQVSTDQQRNQILAAICGALTTLTPGPSATVQFGKLGIGMVPVNILDITQNQSAGSLASILNATTNAAAYAAFQAKADETTGLRLIQTSTTYNTAAVNASDPVNVASATQLVAGRSGGVIIAASNGPIRFYSNSLTTEAARFASDGRFLVNTTSGSALGPSNANKMAVVSDDAGSNGTLGAYQAGVGFALQLRIDSSSATFQNFIFNGSQAGSITPTGGGTGVAYNTSSDARLKTNITDAPDPGSIIDALKVRSWDWKLNGVHEDYGFVAQEEYQVAPFAVTPGDDDPTVIHKQWMRDDSKLFPLMVKEIQSLRARMAALEAKPA